MSEDQGERRDDKTYKRAEDITVKAFGVEVKASGRQLTQFVVYVLGFVILALMLKDHDTRNIELIKDTAAETNVKIGAIVQKQQKQQESLSELTYILALPQDQRNKLRLEMPPSLWEKTHSRDR